MKEMKPSSDALLRIGELSRRQGVSVDRLRAWERRYGLLRPERTAGGFRLYSSADELRVGAMQRHLAEGLSAAQAAAAVLAADAPAVPRSVTSAAGARDELGQALTGFDAARAHAVLDRLIADLGVEDTLRSVVFPFLRDLGERWARAEVHVGQEHFASSLLQARLLELLRAPGYDSGPVALLACAPGDLHTLGVVGLGIALRRRGWQVTYLGADTPLAALQRTAADLSAAVVVVSAAMSGHFAGLEHELSLLAEKERLALAGQGADRALAERVGAELLDADPVTAADLIAPPR